MFSNQMKSPLIHQRILVLWNKWFLWVFSKHDPACVFWHTPWFILFYVLNSRRNYFLGDIYWSSLNDGTLNNRNLLESMALHFPAFLRSRDQIEIILLATTLLHYLRYPISLGFCIPKPLGHVAITEMWSTHSYHKLSSFLSDSRFPILVICHKLTIVIKCNI